MKKLYIKPSAEYVNFWCIEENADNFSMGGQTLTGSIKDRTSDTPGVKEEIMFDDDNKISRTNIWEDEW